MTRTLGPATAFGIAAAGIALFSVMDAFMKSLVLAMGVYNAMLWRTAIATAMGGALWWRAGGSWPRRRAIRLHLLRGGITTAMALLFFWGLARVPMAPGIALTYISPLLALMLAAAVLGERVVGRVVAGSVLALTGVGVILYGQWRAGVEIRSLAGAVAILCSALLYAGNLVVARLQSLAAAPAEIAFVQSAVVTVLLLLAAPWLAQVPGVEEWPGLVAAAALATVSLFLLALAYRHGETGYLATTEYSSFVYAAILGWVVFGEPLATATVAGAAIIVVACVASLRRRERSEGALEPAA